MTNRISSSNIDLQNNRDTQEKVLEACAIGASAITGTAVAVFASGLFPFTLAFSTAIVLTGSLSTVASFVGIKIRKESAEKAAEASLRANSFFRESLEVRRVVVEEILNQPTLDELPLQELNQSLQNEPKEKHFSSLVSEMSEASKRQLDIMRKHLPQHKMFIANDDSESESEIDDDDSVARKKQEPKLRERVSSQSSVLNSSIKITKTVETTTIGTTQVSHSLSLTSLSANSSKDNLAEFSKKADESVTRKKLSNSLAISNIKTLEKNAVLSSLVSKYTNQSSESEDDSDWDQNI